MNTLRGSLLVLALAFGMLAKNAQATNLADINKFLDWAERTYPNLLSQPGQTQTWGGLSFRLYPNHIATGINPVGDVLLLMNGQISYVGNLLELFPMAFGGPQPVTGACFHMALPAPGMRHVQTMSGEAGGMLFNGSIDRTYVAVTPTHIRYEETFNTLSQGAYSAINISGTDTTDVKAEIVDGQTRILVREIDSTISTNGTAPTNRHVKSIFSPSQVEFPARPGQLCIGQTWTSPSVLESRYVDANPVKTVYIESAFYRVEGLETISTKAGKFDTVKISEHHQGSYIFHWVSPTLGIDVLSQDFNLIGMPEVRYETTLIQ